MFDLVKNALGAASLLTVGWILPAYINLQVCPFQDLLGRERRRGHGHKLARLHLEQRHRVIMPPLHPIRPALMGYGPAHLGGSDADRSSGTWRTAFTTP